jgi:hypothetical protein
MEIEAAQTGGKEGMVGGRPSKVASVGGGVGRYPLHLPSRVVEGGAGDRGGMDESGSCRTQKAWGGEEAATYNAMMG